MLPLKTRLTSTRPTLLHNGRLANPIDPYTKALKSLTSKRKKTDEDLIDIMRLEARAGAYETKDGFLAMPTGNVYGCFFEAAKAFKLGKMIKLALRYEDKAELLLVGGKKVEVDKYLTIPGNIDYRLVKVGTSRIMRSRPIVRNWETTHVFELDETLMDKRELAKIFERAGLLGIGDMRPTYGTFKIEMV